MTTRIALPDTDDNTARLVKGLPDGLLIARANGGGWDGSGGLAIQFLARDILTDGDVSGVHAVVRDDTENTVTTIEGTLTDASGHALVIDGTAYDIEDVLALLFSV